MLLRRDHLMAVSVRKRCLVWIVKIDNGPYAQGLDDEAVPQSPFAAEVIIRGNVLFPKKARRDGRVRTFLELMDKEGTKIRERQGNQVEWAFFIQRKNMGMINRQREQIEGGQEGATN